MAIGFGNYLHANLYYPSNATIGDGGESLPTVIWLHPFSHNSGFNEGYMESSSDNGAIYYALANQGYLVMAFDQLGMGGRIYETLNLNTNGGSRFYDRFPNWSQLGKMVKDVSSAVDFLFATSDQSDEGRRYVVSRISKTRKTNKIYNIVSEPDEERSDE